MTRTTREDLILRQKARELLEAGRVPNRLPDHIWGGSGFGDIRCMLCDAPVGPDEVVLEVEYARGDGAGATNPHFHIRCFAALELELRGMDARGDGASPDDRTQPASAAAPAGGSLRRQNGA
jgi:hypothetical protein